MNFTVPAGKEAGRALAQEWAQAEKKKKSRVPATRDRVVVLQALCKQRIYTPGALAYNSRSLVVV